MKKILLLASLFLVLVGRASSPKNYLAGNTYYQRTFKKNIIFALVFEQDSVNHVLYSTETSSVVDTISRYPYKIESDTAFTINNSPCTYDPENNTVEYLLSTYTDKLSQIKWGL